MPIFNKTTQIIDLIVNTNKRQNNFLLSFINFQELVSTRNPTQDQIDKLNSYINDQVQNELSSNQIIYDTISGLNSDITNNYKNLYSIDFCDYSNYTECNTYNNAAYVNKSFSYIAGINIGLMKEMLINNKTLTQPSKSTQTIFNIYTNNEYIFMEKTFDHGSFL